MRKSLSGEVSVLRTLLAVIDNAEAVEVGALHQRYIVRAFGDGSAEVPRRTLSQADVQSLLRRDRNYRLAAVTELEARGQNESAKKLRGDVEIVNRYILE